MANKLAHKADPFQQQAIDSMARGIRIVAPAGSGKSETLARRVAKRIDDGVDPQRILVLTFDNAAKKSLNGFFKGLGLPPSLLVLTHDEFSRRILRKYFADYWKTITNGFQTHISSDSATNFARSDFNNRVRRYPIMTWDGTDRRSQEIRRAIKNEGYAYESNARDRELLIGWLGKDFFRLDPLSDSKSQSHLASYYAQIPAIIEDLIQYDQRMAANGNRDMEDARLIAATLLRDNPERAEKLRADYDEVIIDEAQDLTRVDAVVAWIAAGKSNRVVMAGDDDQTINAWRNASSKFLKDPKLIFSEVDFETFTLDLNYRSPSEILDPALLLVSNNVDRIEKFPQSKVEAAGEVSLSASRTELELDHAVLNLVREELENGRAPEDIAIVCHRHKGTMTTQRFERLLRNASIPLVNTTGDEQIRAPGVWVRTFYKAKGRQWPVVILPYMNEENLPSRTAVRQGDIDSERRMMYVAMTRASERLIIHYLRNGASDVYTQSQSGKIISTNGGSRFLFEAGLIGDFSKDWTLTTEGSSAPVSSTPLDTFSATYAIPASNASNTSPKAYQSQHATNQATSLNAAFDTLPRTIVEKPSLTPDQNPARLPDANNTASSAPWLTASAVKTNNTSPERTITKRTGPRSSTERDQKVRDEWHKLEESIRRGAKDLNLGRRASVYDIIENLHYNGRINTQWKSRLHRWRVARNHAEHHRFALNEADIDRRTYVQHSDELIETSKLASSYLSTLGSMMDSEPVIHWQDKIIGLSQIVSSIELQQMGDSEVPTLRTYEIDVRNEIDKLVALQFQMVLRGVRFGVPQDYRWFESRVFSSFAQTVLECKPKGLQPVKGNRLEVQFQTELKMIHELMAEILAYESPAPDQERRFLLRQIEEALSIQNGTHTDGLILVIKSKA